MFLRTGVVSLCFATAIVGMSAQAPAPGATDPFYAAIRSGDLTQLTTAHSERERRQRQRATRWRDATDARGCDRFA